MNALLVLSCLLAYANAASLDDAVSGEWQAWKLFHEKNYTTTEEETFRLNIFMENKAMIDEHNELARQGLKSYFLKMNNYGDLHHSEFISQMNGLRYEPKQQSNDDSIEIFPANYELPEEIDWRSFGAVTDVKDQMTCGSCYAFSTTGSIEGQHFMKTGELVSLSEQQIVDCSRKFKNLGCSGGLMDNSFRYIKANGGIATEQSYHYVDEEEKCHFNGSTIGATVNGFKEIAQGDENALKSAVATVGPVSVAIDARHVTFQFYGHGVYNEINCSSVQLDHGVLAVGYGTEGRGRLLSGLDDYWLVKNSWGKKWGLDGYIKMSRNKDNQCGIATAASYPIV